MTTPAHQPDLAAWLRAQLDDDERVARAVPDHRQRRGELRWTQCDPEREPGLIGDGCGNVVTYDEGSPNEWQAAHITRHDPARVLAEVDAKRRILDEHAPEWRTVEWPHDQNGKGEAQVCRRCQNAAHTEWNPPWGEAGVLPEGFVAPYVIAPCVTLRVLALPYADRPGYRDEWRPA